MSDKLKIAFFGTSDRSIPILESLKSTHDVVFCLTKRDVRIGRHQEIKPVAVKTWALQNKIPYHTIESLSKELSDVIEHLNTYNPDYIVVADFSFIIPNSLIEAFPNKFINIHFSILPKYRGASPVQHAILNGETTTGITFHKIARKMDTGDIIHQIGYKMSPLETSGMLYDTLFELAAKELPEVIKNYHTGYYAPRTQDEAQATYTYSKHQPTSTFIFKEDAYIDLKKDNLGYIDRAVRAFNPWPIAWCYIKDFDSNKRLTINKKLKTQTDPQLKVKIFEATIENSSDKEPKLLIKSLQIEGKPRIDWLSFSNGYFEISKK